MIYFCADDYGLSDEVSKHIEECATLNKISVFPNFDEVDLHKFGENTRVCLHLNLVEGKCMAKEKDVSLITDDNGNFKHTFMGLFKLWLLNPRKLEKALYSEISAQVLFWKSILPKGKPFCIDSHQHTHMIPSVFKTLMKVLSDENIKCEYLRIPTEPIMPYLTTPSLYHTYSAVNVIKQWLLKFLWLIDKKWAKDIKPAHFLGILFSGKMDDRVNKILPKYIKLSQKSGRDIEVLFHPGYIEKTSPNNVVFEKFYLSDNRNKEFDFLMKL